MGTQFPNFPTSGKNAKILMNTSDGLKSNSLAMTLQASYPYKGKLYTNRVYKLGTNKTLINMRPEVAPRIDIDGLLAGCDITPNAAVDKVDVSAGIILVDGAQVPVTAATLEFTERPASSSKAWVAILTSKAGVLSIIKGTDGVSLATTYGADAGEKPLIGVTDILLGYVQLDGSTSAIVVDSDIEVTDREFAGLDYHILPNIGGVILPDALLACHTDDKTRPVKFTGYTLDTVLSEIPTGKSFKITASASSQTEETFSGSFSTSSISGWTFSYEQLASDTKALDNVYKREGHCGVRCTWPNGFYMQTVGTIVPDLSVDVGAFNKISVSGSCGDMPSRSDEI